MQFKIILEGKKFHGTVSGDLAHSIWKLQVAYYRLVSFALYGDPKAPLSAQEKELYLLNFKIENGSTIATSNIGDLFYTLAE